MLRLSRVLLAVAVVVALLGCTVPFASASVLAAPAVLQPASCEMVGVYPDTPLTVERNNLPGLAGYRAFGTSVGMSSDRVFYAGALLPVWAGSLTDGLFLPMGAAPSVATSWQFTTDAPSHAILYLCPTATAPTATGTPTGTAAPVTTTAVLTPTGTPAATGTPVATANCVNYVSVAVGVYSNGWTWQTPAFGYDYIFIATSTGQPHTLTIDIGGAVITDSTTNDQGYVVVPSTYARNAAVALSLSGADTYIVVQGCSLLTVTATSVPTLVPTSLPATGTATGTATATRTPTATRFPTWTPRPTRTATATRTATGTPGPTSTATAPATATGTATSTATALPSPTAIPSCVVGLGTPRPLECEVVDLLRTVAAATTTAQTLATPTMYGQAAYATGTPGRMDTLATTAAGREPFATIGEALAFGSEVSQRLNVSSGGRCPDIVGPGVPMESGAFHPANGPGINQGFCLVVGLMGPLRPMLRVISVFFFVWLLFRYYQKTLQRIGDV